MFGINVKHTRDKGITLTALIRKVNLRLKYGNKLKNQNFSRIEGKTVSFQENIRCHLAGCACHTNSYIWVSDKLKCLYFEIPKTASRSVRDVLLYNKQHDYEFYKFYGKPVEASKKFLNYYKFAILRCPYQRMISNYKMFVLSGEEIRVKQIEGLFQKKYVELSQLSFEEFLALAEIYRNHHWEQYVEYLPAYKTDEKKWKILLDKIGTTEKMNEDWLEIRKNIGINDYLPHLNTTKQLKIDTILSDQAKIKIEELFDDDLEIYREIVNK